MISSVDLACCRVSNATDMGIMLKIWVSGDCPSLKIALLTEDSHKYNKQMTHGFMSSEQYFSDIKLMEG